MRGDNNDGDGDEHYSADVIALDVSGWYTALITSSAIVMIITMVVVVVVVVMRRSIRRRGWRGELE